MLTQLRRRAHGLRHRGRHCAGTVALSLLALLVSVALSLLALLVSVSLSLLALLVSVALSLLALLVSVVLSLLALLVSVARNILALLLSRRYCCTQFTGFTSTKSTNTDAVAARAADCMVGSGARRPLCL
jgi:hypothetical protein